MKKLLLTAALLLASPAYGAVVGDLGVNPTSGNGAFNNGALPTGLFDDQWTFQLTGFDNFFTIASATNVFPQTSDFISGFNGSIFQIVGAIGPGGGADLLLFGPTFATANCGANCQGFGGSGFLPAGDFYLNIAGNAGSTAGYGGDIAVTAVPEVSTWAMMLLGFLGIAFMGARKQWRGFRLA